MSDNTALAPPAPRALRDAELTAWRSLPAAQQPDWADQRMLDRARSALAARPGLVSREEVDELHDLLARAARGELRVLQAGDCAESPAECTQDHLRRKTDLLAEVAEAMGAGPPVLTVGRVAGQFAKPRSSSSELHGGQVLPSYRGEAVNSPEPTLRSRTPDPSRLVAAYEAAQAAVEFLRPATPEDRVSRVWTSHEALLMDYELPLLRRCDTSGTYLASTHWPWVGERTRQPDGAHLSLLTSVRNPVACKLGPTSTPEGVLELCELLDPHREPGRLTLICRMGADKIGSVLPGLVTAVREAGHPVIWLCDPMHGNTTTTTRGIKTRLVGTLVREVRQFAELVPAWGGVAGGLHLETTPFDVQECSLDGSQTESIGDRYTTLCDPRLNLWQAVAVAAAWS